MIRLSQISCTSLRMESFNFNVNKTVNIPQRHFILTLHIVTLPILLLVKDFNSTVDGIKYEKRLFCSSNKLRTIYPKYYETFKNSRSRVQFY